MNPLNSTRWLSIDLMRALSILFMIQIHSLEFLSPWRTWQPELWWEHIWNFWVSGDLLGGQFFVFLTGFSTYLWLQKNQSKPRSELQRFLIKRGLLLCVISFFLSYYVENFLLNDVLLVIGLGGILIALLLPLPVWLWYVLVGMILLLTPVLQAWSQFYFAPFDGVDWATRGDPLTGWHYYRELLINYWLRGFQPLFPWLVFPLAGYLWAKIMVGQNPRQTLILSATAIGACFGLYLLLATMLWPYVATFSLYPMTSSTIWWSLGMALLFLQSFYYLFDYYRVPIGRFPQTFFQLLSRYSLSIYVFHLFFLVSLIGALSVPQKLEWWTYYAQLLTVPQAIFFIFGLVGFIFSTLWFWDKHSQGKYSLEWWLRFLSRD